MLTISTHALAALREIARPAFVGHVLETLTEAYPHFLPRFPEPIAKRIVVNMLSRASARGLERQRGLMLWCDWMIVIAPNFDDEPEIDHAIRVSPEPLDHSFLKLIHTVEPGAWTRAERRSSNLPLFVPPSATPLLLTDRIAGAIATALHDRPEAVDPVTAAQSAMLQSRELRLTEIEDAALVLAACRSFWGADFLQRRWANELVQERWAPRPFIEALRFRLALEHGRFV